MDKKTLLIFFIASVVVAAIMYWGQVFDSYLFGAVTGRVVWLVIAPLFITYIVKGIVSLFKRDFPIKTFRIVYAAFWALVAVSNLSTAFA